MAEAARAAKILLGPGWHLVECAGDARTGLLVAREDRRALEEAEEDDASLGFREPISKARLYSARSSRTLPSCAFISSPPIMATHGLASEPKPPARS